MCEDENSQIKVPVCPICFSGVHLRKFIGVDGKCEQYWIECCCGFSMPIRPTKELALKDYLNLCAAISFYEEHKNKKIFNMPTYLKRVSENGEGFSHEKYQEIKDNIKLLDKRIESLDSKILKTKEFVKDGIKSLKVKKASKSSKEPLCKFDGASSKSKKDSKVTKAVSKDSIVNKKDVDKKKNSKVTKAVSKDSIANKKNANKRNKLKVSKTEDVQNDKVKPKRSKRETLKSKSSKSLKMVDLFGALTDYCASSRVKS